ncbi:MAG: ferritin-like domain-containing protein [Chthoniobacterales bacterium]|nr:ferritin-like domain-containing protein [Chthoniobacterales bacterium]
MHPNQLAETLSTTPNNLDRRAALRKAGQAGWRMLLASLPLAAGAGCAGVGKIVAKDPQAAADVLNFALFLERRESEFYKLALEAPGLIPASDRAVFEQIGRNETRHVVFLTTGITGIGGTPDTSTEFDHTAHGRFPDVFTNYHTFLIVAQTSEETGVRAYKGQAPNLMQSPTLLTAALRIHSSEGRHVAEIRRIRGLKGWITESESNGAIPATYAGESNVVHNGVDMPSVSKISHRALTEAFDEPLTRAQVMAIVAPFVRKPKA